MRRGDLSQIYFAIERGGQVVARGTLANTRSVFLADEASFTISYWSREGNSFARQSFTTGRSGSSKALPKAALVPANHADRDVDLLIDLAERVIGTSPPAPTPMATGSATSRNWSIAPTHRRIGTTTGPIAPLAIGGAVNAISVLRFEQGDATRVGVAATQDGVAIIDLTRARSRSCSRVSVRAAPSTMRRSIGR